MKNFDCAGHRVSSHEKMNEPTGYSQTTFINEVCGIFCGHFPNMSDADFFRIMKDCESRLAEIYRKARGKRKSGVKKEGEE
jgi:hypothetical protein